MKRIVLLTLILVLSMAAMGKDIKKVVITTMPQMHCSACEQKIKNQLRFERGVKRIETSIERQTVTITYDADKTDESKLIKSLEKIGYKARTVREGERVKREGGTACANM